MFLFKFLLAIVVPETFLGQYMYQCEGRAQLLTWHDIGVVTHMTHSGGILVTHMTHSGGILVTHMTHSVVCW